MNKITMPFHFWLSLFCLTLGIQATVASGQNLNAQEYGDAAYRQLKWSEFGMKDYNHACIFAGLNASDTPREIQSTGNTVQETDFADTTKNGGTYYGAYTLSNVDLGFEQRKAIVTTARQLANAAIPYTAWNAIDPKSGSQSFTGQIADIDNIRCDGVVEYSYEKNALRVWTSTDYPNDWNIATAMGCYAHNNTPGIFISSPEYELSPWAQRGAPSYSPNPKNTYMTRGSVIKVPVCQALATPGGSYCDVAIKATDESGIHRIAAKLPGASSWTFSPRQPQNPTGASYTYTVRVTTPGYLYYYAMDNGGNRPANAQSVYIDLPPLKAVSPIPASGATNTSRSLRLSWSNGRGATSYDVYFGTTNPPPFKQNQTALSYTPAALAANTLYYWRIDSKNAKGTTRGDLWNFRTAKPPQAAVEAGSWSLYE